MEASKPEVGDGNSISTDAHSLPIDSNNDSAPKKLHTTAASAGCWPLAVVADSAAKLISEVSGSLDKIVSTSRAAIRIIVEAIRRLALLDKSY